jgi:hypothetical protein
MIPHFGDFSHWNLVDELSSQHKGRAPDEPPSIAMEGLDFAVGFGLW